MINSIFYYLENIQYANLNLLYTIISKIDKFHLN